ncbi:MAG: type III pantothenate kinase [Candidatus Aerophobetes bacterium]|nr:type III pantothenate kinase [Candidatus Aerophobetes bacterium]
MNLVIDVGNTLTKTGIFEKETLLLKGEWMSRTHREADEWGVLLCGWKSKLNKKVEIKKVVISSVVSPISLILKDTIRKYFNLAPFEVRAENVKVPLLCDNPQEVGADRIANVVAVTRLYKTPAIVVDFGTATAFDVISERGEYLGGVIAPGVETSISNLAEKAEALFPVEFKKPDRVIGKNTRDSLIAGVFYQSLGGVERILEDIGKELGRKAYVIATGGLGVLIGKECRSVDEVNPILTLQGLNFIVDERG